MVDEKRGDGGQDYANKRCESVTTAFYNTAKKRGRRLGIGHRHVTEKMRLSLHLFTCPGRALFQDTTTERGIPSNQCSCQPSPLTPQSNRHGRALSKIRQRKGGFHPINATGQLPTLTFNASSKRHVPDETCRSAVRTTFGNWTVTTTCPSRAQQSKTASDPGVRRSAGPRRTLAR